MSIALIGNPNCGKSTLFNALTGANQRVGNWPGVTVECKTGHGLVGNEIEEFIDLPGTYSLENDDESLSEDERITRDFVLENSESLIINIIDATNLQRSLYLTLQLLDLKRPMIIVLNMIDALGDMDEIINTSRLEDLLGCPVVGISASKKVGFEALQKVMADNVLIPLLPDPKIETLHSNSVAIIDKHLQRLQPNHPVRMLSRFALIRHLLYPAEVQVSVCEPLSACRDELAKGCDNEIDVAIACSRYDAIDHVTQHVIEKRRHADPTLTDKLDRMVLGRFTGIPLFFLSMYLMFFLSISVSSVFNDFFEEIFGVFFVDGFAELLTLIHAPEWLILILAKGIGSGISTVASFIPVISAMFFCLSFLEDSGYLARAAMVVDRGMRMIGLPGKAFVPMLVGFGCSVPAVMGTRTLENSRDRLMSICMIPFMSCGARLPVFALFAVIFFPKHASTTVFLLYLLGFTAAIFTGLVLKYTLLQGKITPFIMELPVYRLPGLRSMLKLTWLRLKGFLFRASKAIILMVTLLSVLNTVNLQGKIQNAGEDSSILAYISQKATPVFEPMGVTRENWPATVGIFTGIFAKEAVMGTLNALYSIKSNDADASFDWMQGLSKAFQTIPDNFSELMATWTERFRWHYDTTSTKARADVSDLAITKIEVAFGSTTAAMAYLIFILLYTPCVAALGAIYREAGTRWACFVALWTFFLAWVMAAAYYQYNQWSTSPSAIEWLIGLFLLFIVVVLVLKMMGQKGWMH